MEREGPNGAGKTTLFNLSSGMPAAYTGSIAFRGQEITGLSPHAISRMGIGEHCGEIALAMRPNLLLLDEPMADMSSDETKNTVAELHSRTGPVPARTADAARAGARQQTQIRKSDASRPPISKNCQSTIPPPP